MIQTLVDNGTIRLGYVSDNEATRIQFPIANTYALFGSGGDWYLLNRRPEDPDAYAVPVTQITTDDDFLYWTVAAYDVAQYGNGECQLQYRIGSVVKMMQRWRTAISASLVDGGIVPTPYETWLDDLAEIADRAEAATEHYPYIGENGNWYVWDVNAGEFVDTGFPSGGTTYHTITETEVGGAYKTQIYADSDNQFAVHILSEGGVGIDAESGDIMISAPGSSVKVNDELTVDGNATVSGNVVADGDFITDNNISANGDLDVSGDGTIDGTLHVENIVGANVTITAGGGSKIEVLDGDAINLAAFDEISISAAGDIALNADGGEVVVDGGDLNVAYGIHAEDSTAGAMGFTWTSASEPSSGLYDIVFTVGNTGSAAVGDRVSCKAGYSWNFFGVITAISLNAITVTADIERAQWPSNFTPWSTSGYFWLPDKPDAGNVRLGDGALSLGSGNKANELGSLACGNDNIADGRGSIVGGKENEAGYASFAMGAGNKVSATMSGAIGYQNTISGYHSFVSGEGNTASGQNCVATGLRSVASGTAANAENAVTVASGNYSHSEGENTFATGRASHAEGRANTTASGEASHAEGYGTKAAAAYSHAEGSGTKTNAQNQHVEGKYNVENSSFIHIIGGGTSDSARKNLFAVSNSGGVAAKGNVYVEANDNSTGGKILATQAWVNANNFTFTVNGTQYKLDLAALLADGYLTAI